MYNISLNNSRDRSADRNRNSRIVSKSFGSEVHTFTDGRDQDALTVSIVTARDMTDVIVDRAGTSMRLNGREARTLYLALEKHLVERSYLGV